MPVNLEDLERAIREALPITHLNIEDQSSGCGESYSIIIVSTVSTSYLGVKASPYIVTIHLQRRLRERRPWLDIDGVSARDVARQITTNIKQSMSC